MGAGLFEHVPLDQMPLAEKAICNAVCGIDAEQTERLLHSEKLSDEDRESIIAFARKTLEAFLSRPKDEVSIHPEISEEK